MSEQPNIPVRVLVLADQPFVLDDLGPEAAERFETRLTRRPDSLEETQGHFRPNVVLVDTTLADGGGFDAIDQARGHAPGTRVMALTPEPPPHDQVALAVRAGAVGFIGVGSDPDTFVTAIDAVNDGQEWFPADETRQVLAAMADHLDTTSSEQRSRLMGVALAFVPLAGLIAAILTLFWREYMGQIGVRPVDLAVDPASRVIDAIGALLLAIGVVGPLLFVGSWLDLLAKSRLNRGPIAWLMQRRTLAHVLVSILWLVIAALLAIGPDAALVLIAGPLVSIALLAKFLDASDELPRVLRIESVGTRGVIGAGLAALFVFTGVLTYETFFVGPDLRTDGVHGILAPKVLGISAHAVLALNVDTGEASELLYLGGNADLYVLVDPCNEDRVDFVSVGAHRLTVIDEITCPDGS